MQQKAKRFPLSNAVSAIAVDSKSSLLMEVKSHASENKVKAYSLSQRQFSPEWKSTVSLGSAAERALRVRRGPGRAGQRVGRLGPDRLQSDHQATSARCRGHTRGHREMHVHGTG